MKKKLALVLIASSVLLAQTKMVSDFSVAAGTAGAINNPLEGYTTTATAAGTTTLTVSSTRLQYFTGSTTQTVALPVTSTLTLGQRFQIVNNSTGVVTVNSSGGNAVVTLAASTSALVTCILTSGTTAASWSANSSTGNSTTGGTVVPKTGNYTLLSTDSGTVFTFSGTTLTATLPSTLPTMPWIVGIKNIGASPLTVARNGNNINGNPGDITLNLGQEISCESDTVTTGNFVCTTPLVGSTTISVSYGSNSQGLSIPTNVALAGNPTTTTQTQNDNSTKVATTAYVDRPTYTPSPGTSCTFVAPRTYCIATGTFTATVPVPALGDEFCVFNDDNVATAITLSAIGSSAMYENSARTAYGTAGTGTLVVAAALKNKVCIFGRDSTHYLTIVAEGGAITVN